MTHPEDLLADHVSGSLAETDRAALNSHLASCARCSDEIDAATGAREALAALADEAVPPSIATVVAEAGKSITDGRERRAPAWQRWLGPAAAVAAAALVLTLVLPKLGGGSSDTSAASGQATTAAGDVGPAADLRLELEATDYTTDTLDALTSSAAREIASGPEGASSSSSANAPALKLASLERAQTAAACIQQAFQQVPGSPIRLIRARFQGDPAYIGLYAEGPGVGQPADALTLRVASVRGCMPLSIAQVPL